MKKLIHILGVLCVMMILSEADAQNQITRPTKHKQKKELSTKTKAKKNIVFESKQNNNKTVPKDSVMEISSVTENKEKTVIVEKPASKQTDQHPQRLIVRNFKILPSDNTASNKDTKKIDGNGRNAALIKIQTSLDPNQTYFDNGNNGVVARVNYPDEIWLYIPAQSFSIVIKNKNYPSIKYFFEEEIAGGKTYSMQITPEGKIVKLVASKRPASISVDDHSIGSSPQEIYLSYGKHEVSASDGIKQYKCIIDVTRDSPSRFELPMGENN